MFVELGELLGERGHRVIPFCAQDERNAPSRYAEYFPVSVDTRQPSLRDIARFVYSGPAARSLQRLLERERVDLAHLHIYYGKLTAAVLQPLRRHGVPIVQTLHEYKLACPVYTLTANGRPCEACFGGRYWQALPRLCNKGSLARTALSVVEAYVSKALGAIDEVDQFIAISDFLARRMAAAGVPRERITTVHNFLDAAQYQPGTDPGDYAVFFGRLETVKGVYSLLEAFAGMPGVRLRIAGTGSEAEPMTRWLQERGVENVELLGFVAGDELHQLVRNAVCTVVPSEWHEPFGLTALESLALGTPVIATRMGGLPEIITAGEDGLLVDAWHPAALRAAVLQLVEHPQRAREMGRAGRVKVEQRFTRDQHYAELSEVYSRAQRHASQRTAAGGG